jgi:2'-5' RNA ligase
MPQGRVRKELAALIQRLAGRLGTEVFAPHVTLLPGLAAPETEVVEGARSLAGDLSPLVLQPVGVDGVDEYFRGLFFRIALDPPLRRTRSSAARRFGGDPEAPFDPHLSLVYGRLEEMVKTDLERELAALAPHPFDVRRLHVWRTEGHVEEWREVARFDMGSPGDD